MLEGCTPYPPEFVSRYTREGYWRLETLYAAITAAAARFQQERPQQQAVRDHARGLTWRALTEESAAIAATLARHGIGAGDRVVITLPNRVEFATLLVGCLQAGAIPVMALPAFRRIELQYLASSSQAKAIAIAPECRGFDHAALARDLRESIPGLRLIFSTAEAPGCIALRESSAQDADPRRAGQTADPLDVALFLLSGGTTGLAKLIPRTHSDYLYNARESAKVCGLGPDSRILLALPAGHNFALACPGLLGALLCGATAVFADSTRASDLALIINRERITHFPCVPALAISLLCLSANERRALASLEVITVGGARLKEGTARRFKDRFPHVRIQQVFGMAEGLLCYTRLEDPDSIALAAQGRPLSAADEIRIVDALGRDVARGCIGELWCRGPYTIRGYYRAADRNREAFSPDGFYKTGDLVRRREDGNLVVEGRIKDQINRGGEKIGAEEVEGYLLAHPEIANAAVVAMPDGVMGERVCAYVTLRSTQRVGLDEIRALMEARGVARFKCPERLEVIDEMPLTSVGKIDKAALRRDIASKLAAERGSGFDRTGTRGD